MAKFNNDKLQKLRARVMNDDTEYTFLMNEKGHLYADITVSAGTSKQVLVAENVLPEYAELIAYLLNHSEKLHNIAEAFTDVMDGVKEHEIKGMTGLPDDRCKEIYKLASELIHC